MNNMETYEAPDFDVVLFETEEVMTTSGGNIGGGIELPDDLW